jgi:hypothetical protein
MQSKSDGKAADLEVIQRAIAVLHEPGQIVELRVPGKFGVISGYYDDHGKLATAVKQLSDEGEHVGVYCTLNCCHEALVARRAKNQLHYDVKTTTSDADIIRRRWLLFDFDPKRPKGESATTEEKIAAKAVMLNVAKTLRKESWPSPVCARSGNGYHLLYRVDEPNDAETAALFKNCLDAIAANFPTDAVHIDTGVYNASRITKAYGSLAAKGANTTERPHRFSQILFVPKSVRVVKRSQLIKLATTIASTKKRSNPSYNEAATVSADDIGKFLAWRDVAVKAVTDVGGGGKKWVLAACPFNAKHTNSPAVFLSSDGVLGFKCFHESCRGKHWKEFRAALEAKKGEKFHFTIRNDGIPYELTPEGIIHHTFTRNGKIQKPLTNFSARIVTNIEADDGVQTIHSLELDAMLKGRSVRFSVPSSEFSSMNWPIEKLGGEAIIAAGAGAKDHARAAIQYLSPGVARLRIFTHWLAAVGEQVVLSACRRCDW